MPPQEIEHGDKDRPISVSKIRSSAFDPSDDLGSPRPLKRQKKTPPTPKTRPSPTSTLPDAVKNKGKEKASSPGIQDDDIAEEIESSSSGASTALRMLHPGSQFTSRASSIEFYAPSEELSSKPASPTANRSTDYDHLAHLFHTHGAARQQQQHHHHLPNPVSSAISPNRAKPITPPLKDPQTDLLSRSEPIMSNRSIPNSNSPVTRSHCRFHKISLPLQADGPRVYFLVPGCSLSDKQLMQIQDIIDHGPAEKEDGRRVVRDLDTLDFSSYVIGVLRQLVGVDLLREQEVYYLPQPGEDHHRKVRRKSAATRLSFRDPPPTTAATTTTTLGSQQVKRRPQYSSLSPPQATPPSSNASRIADLHHEVASEADSSSSLSSLDDTENYVPSPTRRTTRFHKDGVDSLTGASSPPASSKAKKPPPASRTSKNRRSKRLVVDALAYKPPAVSEDRDSSGEDEPRNRRSKLKRSRTIEATAHQDESNPKKKHRRLRLTSSAATVERS